MAHKDLKTLFVDKNRTTLVNGEMVQHTPSWTEMQLMHFSLSDNWCTKQGKYIHVVLFFIYLIFQMVPHRTLIKLKRISTDGKGWELARMAVNGAPKETQWGDAINGASELSVMILTILKFLLVELRTKTCANKICWWHKLRNQHHSLRPRIYTDHSERNGWPTEADY